MKLLNITVENFRNIKFLELSADNDMNVICGENAQGKTNLLEAIWLFCGAKSFRGNKEKEFIKKGEEKANIRITFEAASVKREAEIVFGDKKVAFLNGKALSSPAKLAGNFYAVVFSPDDLSLVKDSPAVRRRFADIAIGQLYPSYIEILKSYQRAVMQRNKVIKGLKFDPTLSVMLDVFEDEIANSGEKIVLYRKKYIETLKLYFPDIYFGISSGKEKTDIIYDINCEKNLRENLRNSRKEDSVRGITSVGPHRDDIRFEINGADARTFGSQGQQRSIALSLKFAQAQVTKEITGEYPVCLLDDVMSELDVSRQSYILNHIKGWQSFITCCDPSNTENLNKGKIIRIKNGGIDLSVC